MDTNEPNTPHDTALAHAVEGLSQTIGALDRTISTLQTTVGVLQTAVFGRWDSERNQQIPGIRDEMISLKDDLESRMVRMEKTATRIDNLTFWAWRAGTPILVIVMLKALGAPTEYVGIAIDHVLRATGFGK